MKIYLLGAANPESIRMIHAVQRTKANVEFAGFLDNDTSKWGTVFFGYPVLGGQDLVAKLNGPDVAFVNLITGSTRVRHETSAGIIRSGGHLENFIHPSIELSMVTLGVGLYLQESVVLQAGVNVSDNVSIHMATLIGHESYIGESVFIAHAVSVSGCCNIGRGTFIGTNASILPRINIGKWVTVGAGAVVTKDVPDYAVVVGNPAKVIKSNAASPSDDLLFAHIERK
jgi:sugar O-acyltransferase (sialic acid O-acetyltransferase NeuD family)